MIEIFIVGVIVLFIFVYTNKIDKYKFIEDNKGLLNLIKEKDYGFLLRLKYGEKITDEEIDALFTKRVTTALLVTALCFFVFISSLSFLNIVICLLVGVFVFKMSYMNLKSFYKAHLNTIDAMLPYYLKNLEVLIHHYTVPVALARSVEDAPEVFKPGLRKMIQRIEAGDSSIEPYMDFAREYPVRDSMRMMRLLYRLGLGEQEKKHEQLLSFSKSVSSLQLKAREMKYVSRLNMMERKTMTMLVCTGAGALVILLISIVSLFINAM